MTLICSRASLPGDETAPYVSPAATPAPILGEKTLNALKIEGATLRIDRGLYYQARCACVDARPDRNKKKEGWFDFVLGIGRLMNEFHLRAKQCRRYFPANTVNDVCNMVFAIFRGISGGTDGTFRSAINIECVDRTTVGECYLIFS